MVVLAVVAEVAGERSQRREAKARAAVTADPMPISSPVARLEEASLEEEPGSAGADPPADPLGACLSSAQATMPSQPPWVCRNCWIAVEVLK